MKLNKRFLFLLLTIFSLISCCVGFSNMFFCNYDIAASMINVNSRLEIYGRNQTNLSYQTDWHYYKISTYYQFRTFDIYYESIDEEENAPLVFEDTPIKVLINTNNDQNHFGVELISGNFPSSYGETNASKECMCDELLFKRLSLPYAFPQVYKFNSIKNSLKTESEIIITGVYRFEENNNYLNSKNTIDFHPRFSMITNSFEFKLSRPKFKAIVRIPSKSNKFAISSIFSYLSEKDNLVEYRMYNDYFNDIENTKISKLLNLETKLSENNSYRNTFVCIFSTISFAISAIAIVLLLLFDKVVFTKKFLLFLTIILLFLLLLIGIIPPLFIGKTIIFFLNENGAVMIVLYLTLLAILVHFVSNREKSKKNKSELTIIEI